MILPIPLHLLTQNAEYEELDSSGRYGETYLPVVTLENIRVDVHTDYSISTNDETKTGATILFFDIVNSKPAGVVFREKSKITIDGHEWFIKKVNPIRAFNLHHYELELV